jgi:hypothetical protein
MADTQQNTSNIPEKQPEAPQHIEKPERKEGKEVKEAKISVGIEAGEIIEGAEVPSGEVIETEKKKKEGYTGGAAPVTSVTAAKAHLKPLPPVHKMVAQVEHELKSEIKDLKKKVKSVMKQGGVFEASQLNILIAKLRRLKEVFASLAFATADMIKELWVKYVKEKK